MTAQLEVMFYLPAGSTPDDLKPRLDTLADLQGIQLGTVKWSTPHEREGQPGQWVTATAPITRQPEHPKRGKKR